MAYPRQIVLDLFEFLPIILATPPATPRSAMPPSPWAIGGARPVCSRRGVKIHIRRAANHCELSFTRMHALSGEPPDQSPNRHRGATLDREVVTYASRDLSRQYVRHNATSITCSNRLA